MEDEKKVKKQFVVLHKNASKFYNAYGTDAYIINYLFDYKVLDNNKCGFPDNCIHKVVNKLEELKISYQIIYNDKDPIIKNYRKINNYDKYLNLAREKMSLSKRMELVIQKIKNADEKVIEHILEEIEKCIE